MYKLLIVDDEEIEREGMARFIQWEQYGIEIAGTAWNGIEGLEKIRSLKPDIVMTDIKMPVMNGIELIKKAKSEFEDIEFIVLSGYGEYEFTSQAMQEGIRHYLLKPCDEEQIAKVIEAVSEEIEQKKAKNLREREYKTAVHRLLPRAKEQVFRDMLLNREHNQADYKLFLKEYGNESQKSLLLAIYQNTEPDTLGKFILENIMTELLESENVYLFTQIRNTVYFLINEKCGEKLEEKTERLKTEYKKLNSNELYIALSDARELADTNVMYEQIQELLHIGIAEKRSSLLRYGLFREMKEGQEGLVDYQILRQSQDYGEILAELIACFLKMEADGYSLERKQKFAEWILKVLYGEQYTLEYHSQQSDENTWQLLLNVAKKIAEKNQLPVNDSKEAAKMKRILEETFHYIGTQDLSIQFLAKEVLFMNEDYLSRIFTRLLKQKFSVYLLQHRIRIAEKMFCYRPDIKISEVAEMVGYSPDGQYFSKAFKKVTDQTPTKYKEDLNRIK